MESDWVAGAAAAARDRDWPAPAVNTDYDQPSLDLRLRDLFLCQRSAAQVPGGARRVQLGVLGNRRDRRHQFWTGR